MRIGKYDLDIPNELLNAQADGNLVIFAGAGVSMSPPSCYPNFPSLANDISMGTIEQELGEPIERFLGRLNDRSVRVHKRAKHLLSKPESKPNLLHNDIIAIAASSGNLRIITTNFDNHFSTVAKTVLNDKFEIFNAPALPLGNKFTGIVYLHGSVDSSDESRLVLTDEDFAQAYLTQGWATRFLLSLFQEYTVLFVGYSHHDTVMQYLARGLPSGDGKRRYALTPVSENMNEYWNYLGITPIPYPQEHSNDHTALDETIRQWADNTKLGALDHNGRIKSLVTSAHTILTNEDNDYIEAILINETKLQFFTRYAIDSEWLHWVEGKGVLDQLFNPFIQLDECQRKLAYWIAGKFACDHSEDCMSLIQSKGQQLNPMFWGILVDQLSYRQTPDNDVLVKWIHLLAQLANTPRQRTKLCGLLRKCTDIRCLDAAALLLDHVTQLEFNLGSRTGSRSAEGDNAPLVYWELTVPIEYHDFEEVWDNVLQPHIERLAEKVASISIYRLEQAYHMLLDIGNEYGARSLSEYSDIASNDQDSYSLGLNPLISLARNSLNWIMKNRDEQSHLIIRSLITSEAPILRRFAIHCVTESGFLTPDSKIKWLLKNKLLYEYFNQPEVYRLLEENYSLSSEKSHLQLIKIAIRGPYPIHEDKQGIRSEIIFNLISWLHTIAPNCKHTAELLEQLQREHPDFIATEPFRHRYRSGWSFGSDEISASDMLERNPKTSIEWFLCYGCDPNQLDASNKLSFIQYVADAASKSWEWGWNLLNSMAAASAWDSQLWDGIIDGLAKSTKTTKQWRRIISFVENNTLYWRNVAPVLSILREVMDNAEFHLPIIRMERLFTLLWDRVSDTPAIVLPSIGGWFFTIKDHVGGIAVQFWVSALWRYLKQHRINHQIPKRYKHILEHIITDDQQAMSFGRAMLAYYIDYLYSLDNIWTQDHILPLLDWDIDDNLAERAWQCHLNNTHVNLNAFEASMDYYRKTFPRMGARLDIFKESFIERVALFSVEGSANPLDGNWLISFLESDPKDRERWAECVQRSLKDLDANAIANVWHRWMDDYWERRIDGIPRELGQVEVERMMEWLPYLGPVFPHAVKRLCSSPPPGNTSHLYHSLLKLDWLNDHVEALADLLYFLLTNQKEWPFWSCKEATTLLNIIKDGWGSQCKIKNIENRLCELDCSFEDDRNSE
ncbi:MAG: DUF4020 domain-containing protein [Armatimonadota bacterium]